MTETSTKWYVLWTYGPTKAKATAFRTKWPVDKAGFSRRFTNAFPGRYILKIENSWEKFSNENLPTPTP